MGWMIQGSNPGRGKRLSLLQAYSGAHPASHSTCTGGLSLGVQQSVCETDNSPTSRMRTAVLPHPIYAFIACAGTLLLFYSYVNKTPCLILEPILQNTCHFLSMKSALTFYAY